jgi:hypothetical protein
MSRAKFAWPLAALAASVAVTAAAASASDPQRPATAPPRDVMSAPPPLGWSSWNSFMNSIDANVIAQTAQAMASSGLKAAGYRYVNIDEGWWQGQRDAAGNIVVDQGQWPGGMAATVRRIHALGLKAGIYTDAGRNGCGYYYPQTAAPAAGTGSEGHYDQDLTQFARWGFDYVKVDWCGGDREGLDPQQTYTQIAGAVAHAEAATGHHLTFSICEWGREDPWVWGPATGDLWRVSGDISYVPNTASFAGVLGNADTNQPLAEYQHNGRYNDPDMLEAGANGLSPTENRAHLSLWAVMGAPLILGNDLRAMDDQLARDLGNRDMLAVDQDPLGLQGYQVAEDDAGRQVWSKVLAGDGRRAVVLLNRGVQPAPVTVRWADLGLKEATSARDVWTHRHVRLGGDAYTAVVAPHGVTMLVVQGTDAPARTAPRSGDTFGPIDSAVDGFTVARLAFANPTSRPQTLMLADNDDPASQVTLPPTDGRTRTLALTLRVKPGANTVTVSQLSDPALSVKSLSVLPRPALPPRFDAADPSSELSGGAVRGGCPTCPGGSKVGYVGSGDSSHDGVLTMHIHSDDAGAHTLSVWYLNGDVGRTFDLSVNGGAPQTVTAPSTFSWSTVGSVRVPVALRAGDNTLTFSNHGGRWAPDLAAVVIVPG